MASELVPIRIDLELEGERLRDSFLWHIDGELAGVFEMFLIDQWAFFVVALPILLYLLQKSRSRLESSLASWWLIKVSLLHSSNVWQNRSASSSQLTLALSQFFMK
jgi:hypothetical protein